MNTLIGCVGGFCSSREKCAHYLQGQANTDIRLCGEIEEPEILKELERLFGKEEEAASIIRLTEKNELD